MSSNTNVDAAGTVSNAALVGRLESELRGLVDANSRVDAKATTLLSLVGVGLAIVAAVLATGTPSTITSAAKAALLGAWLGASAIAGSAFLLTLAVRPTPHPTEPGDTSRQTVRFGDAKSADEVIERIRAELQDDTKNARHAAAITMQIARRVHQKNKMVRHATNLLLVAIVVLMLSSFGYFIASW